MKFRGFCTMVAVTIGTLVPLASAPAKGTGGIDAEVQLLANFPALQKLGARGNAKTVRRYLARVASAYRAAGYGDVAGALPKADEVIVLFGEPKGEASRRDRRTARAALRKLRSALAADAKILLPAKSGERIPNYHALATAFAENARRALKNIADGKRVGTSLRNKSGTAWVSNVDGDQFSLQGSLSTAATFSFDESGIIKVGAGTTYLGGFNVAGFIELTPVSFFDVAGYRRVAFPPDIEIPLDWADFRTTTFPGAITIGEASFPSGTRIVSAPVDFVIPDGSVEILAGTIVQLAAPSPSPSPTPAE